MGSRGSNHGPAGSATRLLVLAAICSLIPAQAAPTATTPLDGPTDSNRRNLRDLPSLPEPAGPPAPVGRALLQCNGDSIECSSWGPGQCNRPGVPQACPCMCGERTGGGGPPIIVGGGGGGGGGSCFPAAARVLLPDGSTRRMDQLSTGDVVAVRLADGKVGYQPIYAWGHREAGSVPALRLHLTTTSADESHEDPAAPATTTTTTTTTTTSLELTPTHFVLTANPNDKGAAPVAKRAGDVPVGDALWALSAQQQLLQYKVSAIEPTTMQGLYNPFTLGGNIIVDGVVASSHSWWFADAAFDALGLPTSWLPQLYQVVLAPARALWFALGPKAYVKLYEQLDGQLDFANSLSSNAGMFGAAARLGGVMLLAYGQVLVQMVGAWLASPAAGAAVVMGVVAAVHKGSRSSKLKSA